MRFVLVIGMLLLTAVGAMAQRDTLVRAAVTYRAGDAIYLSAGRAAGLHDSTDVYVVTARDTVGVLRVFAVSSGSAVCAVVRSSRDIRVGDSVVAHVPIAILPNPRIVAAERYDSLRSTSGADSTTPVNGVHDEPSIRVRGRVSIQYLRTMYGSADRTSTQPGLVVNLRGEMPASPWRFDLYGNIRSRTIGNQLFFGSVRTDQTRIYRMGVSYDDGLTSVSVGRVSSSIAPTAGLLDGILLSHAFGNLSLGVGAGYDPLGAPGNISTDGKKLMVFGSYTAPDRWQSALTLGYARNYTGTILSRELVTAGLNLVPHGDLWISSSVDIDLRTLSGETFTARAQVTSLYSTCSYRPTSFVSIGLGVTAWRPVYALPMFGTLPDSLMDRTLRTEPSVNLTVYPVRAVVLYNSYNPRSGAGVNQYRNYSSASIADLPFEGMSVTGSWTMNAAEFARTRIGAVSLRAQAGTGSELGLRLQSGWYDITGLPGTIDYGSLAFDAMTIVTRRVVVTGSLERMWGNGADGYVLMLDTALRF